MLKTISALLILISFNAAADDAVITVTGRVVQSSCTIEKKGDTIDLGQIYASQLGTSGRSFMLFRVYCPPGVGDMTVVFSGNPSPFPDFFDNEGTAKNVYVKLMVARIDGMMIPQLVSNNSSWSRAVVYIDDKGGYMSEFLLSAAAISPNNNAVEGTIRTSINITFTYN